MRRSRRFKRGSRKLRRGYRRRRYRTRRRSGRSRRQGAVSTLRRRGTRTVLGKSRWMGTIFPQRCMVKLPYSQPSNVLVPDGLLAARGWLFRLNSVYDPDYTSLFGHQPRGLDQWAALYAQYRVHACSYNVEYYCTTADNTVVADTQYAGSFVSQYTSNVSSNPSWYLDLTENPSSAGYWQLQMKPVNKFSYAMVANKWGTYFYTGGKANINSMLARGSASSISVLQTPDLYTFNGFNPNIPIYLQVFSGMQALAVDQVSIGFNLKLNYLVEFADLYNFSSS